MVGHHGEVEPTRLPLLPGADYKSCGAPFGHCDGARLGFDDGRFISVQSVGADRAAAGGTKAGRR